MKYRRTKPNAEPWKRKPAQAEERIIDDTAQQISDMLSPVLPTLLAVGKSLDEMCAVNGHRYVDGLTHDGVAICATCGREKPEAATINARKTFAQKMDEAFLADAI